MNKEIEFLQSVESYRDLIHDEANHQAQDDLFCECNFISEKQIENAARNMIYIDFELWLQKEGAGSGCGSCLKSACIKTIYSKYRTNME